MKILNIVGTRPQFLKLAPLLKTFEKNNIDTVTIHTGQHYDKNMSDDIFDALNIKNPEYRIIKKGETQLQSLSNMIIEIEKIFMKETPDKVIVFGDCDTTIAGAIVARKMKIKLVHIESGMRSYNKDMPEEINRLITDHISDLLLCSTKDSLDKLKKENIKNCHYVGNLQIELLEKCSKIFTNKEILTKNNLIENEYVLLTIHREYNTNKVMLEKIFNDLSNLTNNVIFPIHPRTMNIVKKYDIQIPSNILLIDPVNYLNMIILEKYSRYIITDSGGVQPEAWYLKKKCIVMRSETEWFEPLENNNNILYDYKTPL